MDKSDYKDYYNFLSKRSRLALYYRRFYLYPFLSRFLSGRVLDVGCGIGDFLKFYKQSVGVDINPWNIDYCKKRGLSTYLVKDGRYPFENGSFDGAIIDNVLEHLDDPLSTLTEIHRVLIPYGTMIVGVPGKKGYESDPDHKRFYDESSLKDFIIRFGFTWMQTLRMPFRFPGFNRFLSQYCIYGIFRYSV